MPLSLVDERAIRESAEDELLGDRLGSVMDAHDIETERYRTTRQDLAAAFSVNGIGVTAATTGVLHPVFAMLAMILSVSAVLGNSFAGQLLTADGVKPDFTADDPAERAPGEDGPNHADSSGTEARAGQAATS